MEAQRLGLEAHASDLNPVAVLINKAMIEIPPRFAGRAPVNPDAQAELARGGRWNGKGRAGAGGGTCATTGDGCATKPRSGSAICIRRLKSPRRWVAERPDLQRYVGRKLTVTRVAVGGARSRARIRRFAHVDVPLASTFLLSTKKGKEAYVEPVIEDGGYRFTVKDGAP